MTARKSPSKKPQRLPFDPVAFARARGAAIAAMQPEPDPYPECAKIRANRVESQTLGLFVDWLEENDMAICTVDGVYPLRYRDPVEKLLARYFDIDLVEVDRERRRMLEGLPAREEPSFCPTCGANEHLFDKPLAFASKVGAYGPSIRTLNILDSAGVKTLRQLAVWTRSGLARHRGIGSTSIHEIHCLLHSHSLCFGMTTAAINKVAHRSCVGAGH